MRLCYLFKKAQANSLPHLTIAKTKHSFGVPAGLRLSEHKQAPTVVNQSLVSLSTTS